MSYGLDLFVQTIEKHVIRVSGFKNAGDYRNSNSGTEIMLQVLEGRKLTFTHRFLNVALLPSNFRQARMVVEHLEDPVLLVSGTDRV